jgi:DNA invertase Pin-like site-specific DNA recombinase
MEEKITAVYLLAWKSELLPEDGDSFERPMENQKKECFEFLRSKGIDASKAVVYTSRKDLLKDVDRDLIARLVVHDLNRLGANREDIDGILFELKMREVEVLSVS